MKVKELISELQKLDPEKNIWVEYDSYRLLNPCFDIQVNEEEAEAYEDLSKGDYIMQVG